MIMVSSPFIMLLLTFIFLSCLTSLLAEHIPIKKLKPLGPVKVVDKSRYPSEFPSRIIPFDEGDFHGVSLNKIDNIDIDIFNEGLNATFELIPNDSDDSTFVGRDEYGFKLFLKRKEDDYHCFYGSATSAEFLYTFNTHTESGEHHCRRIAWKDVEDDLAVFKHGRRRELINGVAPQSPKELKTRNLQINNPTIDVVVAYTRRAMCREAMGVDYDPNCNITDANIDSIENSIDLAIFETNNILSSSGINGQLRLVHSYFERGYEDEYFSLQNMLRHVENPFDGFLDMMQDRRDYFGADVMLLVSETDQQACGISSEYDASNPNSASAVVKRDCLVGTYTFAHEIGHLLGLGHDRASEEDGGDPNGYAYGWVEPVNKNFRTVMSLSTSCPDLGCPRLPFFSNDDFQTAEGEDLGDANNDNVRAAIENWDTISNINNPRDLCTDVSDCDDGDPCTSETCDTSSGECFLADTCQNDLSCNGDEIYVNMELLFLVYPTNTSWALIDNCTDTVTASGGPYTNTHQGATVPFTQCVPRSEYKLSIYNSMGDVEFKMLSLDRVFPGYDTGFQKHNIVCNHRVLKQIGEKSSP